MERFIADSMLGKLAKWMMIAGFDVAYKKKCLKSSLLKMAREEERIILTRDTTIDETGSLLIDSDNLWDQFEQVLREFGSPPFDQAFSRCIRCNKLLVSIEKKDVAGKVPPFVYKAHDLFSMCPACERIYWAGSHYQQMKDILNKFRHPTGMPPVI